MVIDILNDETEEKEEPKMEAPLVEEKKMATEGAIPGTIILENTTGTKIGITLSNGRHISLLPFTRTSTGHRSKPFAGNLLPDTPSNQTMLAKGIIKKIKL